MKIRLLLPLFVAALLLAPEARADEAAQSDSISVFSWLGDKFGAQSSSDEASAEESVSVFSWREYWRPFEEGWMRETGYLGFSGVIGVAEVGGSVARQTNPGTGGGFNIRAGYRMFRYAAIELEAEWLDDIGGGLDNPYLFTLNFRFYYPMGPYDRIQPYAVGGVGAMVTHVNNKQDVTGGFRTGIGVDFYVTEHWSIGPAAEWVSTTSEDPAVQYISVQLGVQYMF